MRLRSLIVACSMLLSFLFVLDAGITYLALQFLNAVEVNPISAWLMKVMGIEPTLILGTSMKLGLLALVVHVSLRRREVKVLKRAFVALLCVLAITLSIIILGFSAISAGFE
ncbi:MAG: hypothetical protein DRJ98_01710 [Thermoprotei archaeon]|nr:MAG: hypothetical protein DRJ98_01710 [Thermoprotei archaeon]RLF17793.1 MAG: hypothetical protein DRN06_03085 [Thermoprotei archaeon]